MTAATAWCRRRREPLVMAGLDPGHPRSAGEGLTGTLRDCPLGKSICTKNVRYPEKADAAAGAQLTADQRESAAGPVACAGRGAGWILGCGSLGGRTVAGIGVYDMFCRMSSSMAWSLAMSW